MATTVISSIIVFSDLSSSFSDVNTIKQIPTRLDEALSMCGDFSGVFFTIVLFASNNCQY